MHTKQAADSRRTLTHDHSVITFAAYLCLRLSCPQLGLGELQRIRDQGRYRLSRGSQQKRFPARQPYGWSSADPSPNSSVVTGIWSWCTRLRDMLVLKLAMSPARRLLERLVYDELDDRVRNKDKRWSGSGPESGKALVAERTSERVWRFTSFFMSWGR